MASPTFDQVLANYIEKRDRLKEIAERHKAELQPITDAMQVMENWFMHQLNTLGITQMKAEGVGTVFKSTTTSCTMADPVAFKSFVFEPVTNSLISYFEASGKALTEQDKETIKGVVLSMPMWDMVDFRTGKKGIKEYMDNENKIVPGVNITTMDSVGIRRS